MSQPLIISAELCIVQCMHRDRKRNSNILQQPHRTAEELEKISSYKNNTGQKRCHLREAKSFCEFGMDAVFRMLS